MATNWSRCERLAAVAGLLIPEFHQHLRCNGVRLEFLQRDDEPKEGYRPKRGGVAKVASMAAFLAGDPDGPDGAGNEPFFVLWVPEWATKLEDEEFAGLVDHLLCYCGSGRDDEGNVKIRKQAPDFVGFEVNVQRCGLWWEGLRKAYAAMKDAGQLTLALEGAGTGRPALTVAGMGALETGQDGEPIWEVPMAFRFRGPCNHEWDSRKFGRETCPACGASCRGGAADLVAPPEAAVSAAVTAADGEEGDWEEDEAGDVPQETGAEEPVTYAAGGLPGSALVDQMPAPTPYVVNGGRAETAKAGRPTRPRGVSKRSLRQFQQERAEHAGEGETSASAELLAGGGA